jgi:hypothetical protein
MGDLMRRYWHPIAGAAEFQPRPGIEARTVKPVRILGEDLTLYRAPAWAQAETRRSPGATRASSCPTRRS